MTRSIATVVAIGFLTSAHAEQAADPGPGIYVCDALTVAELNDEGRLENTNFAKAVAMYESRFAVDRKTGPVTP